MSNTQISSRLFGAGILIGFALDITSNFWLQDGIRIGTGALGLFEGAVAQPEKIGAIVLMGLASGFVALAMAGWLCSVTVTRPAFWLALTYLGAKAAALGMGGLEFAGFQMLRSVGEMVLQAQDSQTRDLAEPLQALVRSLRNGAHFPHMMVGGFSALLLYLILMSAGFIPRVLGVLGVIASASQMIGVFTGVLGHEVHVAFLAPLFFVHLTLALWVLILGFRDRAVASVAAGRT